VCPARQARRRWRRLSVPGSARGRVSLAVPGPGLPPARAGSGRDRDQAGQRVSPPRNMPEPCRPGNLRCCYACSKLTTLGLWPPSLHASFVTTLRRSCGVWRQVRRSKSSKTTALWRRSSRFRAGGNGCPHKRSAVNSCGWDQIPPACLRNCGQLSPRRRTIYLGDPPAGVGGHVRLYRP
jgi:hypothetical protein